MRVKDALDLLDTAQTGRQRSNANSNLTMTEFVDLIKAGLEAIWMQEGNINLKNYDHPKRARNSAMIKKIYQAVQNTRNPYY